MIAAHPRPDAPPARDAIEHLSTVRDWIRWTHTHLVAAGAQFGQGTDNAHDEAVWMVLWSLRLPLDAPEPYLEARVLPGEAGSIAALVARRCTERLPTAYLTGEAWLRGLSFVADDRALIPRSLLVEAIEETLPAWLPSESPARILDLCTGGGSVAIAAALRFLDSAIDATDLSETAIALATENRARYGLQDRLSLHTGDLYRGLPPHRYDLILCNPPYVNQTSMDELPPEFRHEPRQALAGGIDGMDLIRRIIAEAPDHLAPEGLLVIEIGHEADHFESAFPGLSFAYLPVTAGERMIVALQPEAIAAWSGR